MPCSFSGVRHYILFALFFVVFCIVGICVNGCVPMLEKLVFIKSSFKNKKGGRKSSVKDGDILKRSKEYRVVDWLLDPKKKHLQEKC